MANLSLSQADDLSPYASSNDPDTDYGPDFTTEEEDVLNELLARISTDSRRTETAAGEVDSKPKLALKDIEDHEAPRAARIPRIFSQRQEGVPASQMDLQMPEPPRSSIVIEEAVDLHKANVPNSENSTAERAVSVEPTPEPQVDDRRTPLERFRTAPKKTLSVTDLISPSWCELQYWYTLTRHGRKRRTPAMRQGSAVHKTLEEQVHEFVKVDVTTKEDAWGLRIWNVIQGLKTLRETGMTRELEVWGLIDGLVVNGVIDEVSHVCPDRELELEAISPMKSGKGFEKNLEADQSTIEKFLKASSPRRSNRLNKATNQETVYITDVKTRGYNSLPKGASFRPTLMQLMIYRRLLCDLASDSVDSNDLFARYQIDGSAPFSDSFIAQIGNLNPNPPTSQDADGFDPVQTILTHNSPSRLWSLLTTHYARTFPVGAAGISPVLKAEYRSQADGTILGAKTFLHDDDVLQKYLADEMRWWRGEREAVGVPIDEAYKCRSCDFAEGCPWRIAKTDEALQKQRTRSRELSSAAA
ncbi:MAG: hypothetical protein M1833_000493 [Piccolia ochrophora]|nr:MAG: hypothetical protein M1833_000493 [Piccolia ochrophora]